MPGSLTVAGATLAAAVLDGSLWVGLGTGQSPTGLLGEPTEGGYARAAVTLAASGALITHAAPIAIGETTISFPGLTHAGVFTAASAGDCLWVFPLSASVTLAGDGVNIAAGDLRLIVETAS